MKPYTNLLILYIKGIVWCDTLNRKSAEIKGEQEMAQTKTKKVSSPCEQYVVAKLESVEKELDTLKREHALLKKAHQDLVELVRLGTKDFKVELGKSNLTGDNYISVFWKSDFIDLCSVDLLQDNPNLTDLINLIKKGQARVEREQ